MKKELLLVAVSIGLTLSTSGSAFSKSKNWAIGPIYHGTGKTSSIHPEPVKPVVQGFKGKVRIGGRNSFKGRINPSGFKGFKGFKQ